MENLLTALYINTIIVIAIFSIGLYVKFIEEHVRDNKLCAFLIIFPFMFLLTYSVVCYNAHVEKIIKGNTTEKCNVETNYE